MRLVVSSPRLASLVNTIPVTFIAFFLLLQHVTGLQHGVGFDDSALGRDADLLLFPVGVSAAHDGVLADLGVLAQNGVAPDSMTTPGMTTLSSTSAPSPMVQPMEMMLWWTVP